METSNTKQIQNKFKKRELRLSSVYSRCLITRTIMIPITSIGKNIKQTIENNIASNFEGKCVIEGYIKPNSSKLISYSSGLIDRAVNIVFEVVFECEVCFLVEGTLIQCTAKNITKAGIKAESSIDVPSPVIVFIARDHHYNNQYFNSIQEGDKFQVRVIGQRFELNDRYVSIIGELVKPKPDIEYSKKDKIGGSNIKPKLIIEED
jgi:DNA-directed RNA polymerase subunit E'/Rpb7